MDEASDIRSWCRVWSLDVEDRGTDYTDSDDDACSSVGGDRLAVDQARRDVDEVALAEFDQLAAPGPELDRHPSAGDVAVGGVVPMVVPAGRGATGEDDEAGPDPIVGEGLAALDVGGLFGRWVLKRLPRDDLGAVHGLLRSRRVPTGACACRHGSHNPTTSHDRVTAAPEYGRCPGGREAVRGRSTVEAPANAGASACRSAAGWPAAGQLAIGEHHIYDF